MHFIRTALAAAAACLVTFAPLSLAAATPALGNSDRQFVDRALLLNATALKRAQVVESSADSYVLDYAEAIVGDRQAANRDLVAIAQAANYHSSSPTGLESGVSPTARPNGAGVHANEHKLGSDFAPVPYFTAEVKANQQAVALYRAQSANGANSALRQYAAKFLPKMQGELNQATHLLHVEMSLHPAREKPLR